MLETVIDNSNDMVWAIDNEYKLLFANKAYIEVIKDTEAKEIRIGESVFYSWYQQNFIDYWRANYDRCLKGESFSIESSLVWNDEIHYLDNSLVPLKNDEKGIYGVVVFSRDISERTKANSDLITLRNEVAQKEHDLRMVTDNMPVLISHKSKDFRYLYANSAYTELFGLTTDEIVGKSVVELIGEKAFKLLVDQLEELRNGKKICYLSPIKDKNGRERVYRVTNLPEMENGVYVGFYTLGLDITELREAEEALKESEFEINETQQKTGLGSWTYDRILLKYHWSREMFNIFGLDPDKDVISRSVYEKHIHKLDFHHFNELFEKSINYGIPFVVELRVTRIDGSVRICICIGEAIVNHDGKVIKLKGTLQDITQRRKMVDELRESEVRFKNMFSKHGSIMLLIEPGTGKILDANEAASDFYGYSVSELCVMNIDEINVLPKNEVVKKYSKANAEKSNSFIFPHRLNSGEIRTVEVYSSTISYSGTQLLFSIIHDITERVKIEKELEESNRKYKLLFDAASDPIVITDFTGQIIDVNEMAIKEYGFTRKELLHLNAKDLDAPELKSLAKERIEKAINEGFALFETKHQRKDKSILYSFVHCRTMVYAGRDAIYCVCRNNTEQKEAELLIEAKNQELQKLNNEKDKFFSIIAHDLRSPFNSVLGLADLLKASLQENNMEEIAQYVEMIEQSANKATNLLNNLMEWSRSQTGRITFCPVEYDLIKQSNDIIQLYNSVASQKGIQLIGNLPAELKITADKDMLATVLRNLISNAIKFTHFGGKITLNIETDKKVVLVKVIDTGVGIPEMALDKLFRIDSKYSTSGTNEETGTGLGLILCKEFVVKHNGQIGVNSTIGKGSEFWFTIPVNQPQ